MERGWLGDYLADFIKQLPAVDVQRVEQPLPMLPQQQQRVMPPNVVAGVTVPLPTGEIFARGMYAPQDPRQQDWRLGYRMNF